jgi:hypothetical protein
MIIGHRERRSIQGSGRSRQDDFPFLLAGLHANENRLKHPSAVQAILQDMAGPNEFNDNEAVACQIQASHVPAPQCSDVQ